MFAYSAGLSLLADLWSLSIGAPVALASVAVLGYLFGRQKEPQIDHTSNTQGIVRAKVVAMQLETIADSVRKNLANHHLTVARFKDRISELAHAEQQIAWTEMCHEAEEILKPTMRLTTELTRAYDQIRQQSNYLVDLTQHSIPAPRRAAFTEVRR